MTTRRTFIQQSLLTGGAVLASGMYGFAAFQKEKYSKKDISAFAKRLKPLGRILEFEGYYVWGTSPIVAPDGKIHVFFSRWDAKKGMGGWINGSEIAHAVADKPEGPYSDIETILAPRGEGFFDGTTCHNPHIQYVDGKYCLFYIDYSKLGNNRQLEDGNVFMENGRFYMLARDMGRFDHEVGIILESEDGINWSEPRIGYFGYSHYLQQPPAPPQLKKYGRFERPQVLMQKGHPTHLFVATQGGKYMTSSAFVFEVK